MEFLQLFGNSRDDKNPLGKGKSGLVWSLNGPRRKGCVLWVNDGVVYFFLYFGEEEFSSGLDLGKDIYL